MVEEYGLIGRGISHSFSANYFNNKFSREGIQARYSLYDLEKIDDLKSLLESHPNLRGLNVTSPYKRDVIKYLDELSDEANELQAVNTISIIHSSSNKIKLKGFNTDYQGFKLTLSDIVNSKTKAIVLGTGGASAAVGKALSVEGIPYLLVSRNPKRGEASYSEINSLLPERKLIINATPVGMYPRLNECPDLDYDKITDSHICYDLIYNPEETLFLKKSKEKGAKIINGMQMLINQAEQSWKIWQSTK